MKRIMNFRLFLYIALSLIASTLLSVYVFASEKSKLVFLIVCAVSIFVCLILTLIFKKKFLIILLVLLTAFIIPVLSVYSKSISLNQNCSKNVENCQFYGKIYTRKADLDKKVIKLYLTDVKINSNENINGDIFVYINTENLDFSKLEVGTTVQVNGTIKLYSLQDEDLSKAVSKISSGVVGDCYIRAYNIKVLDDKNLTLRDKFKETVYDKSENVRFGDIGYAMLFGDTAVLDPDIKGVFQESGTAHLLAVSGFHVSLVVLMLSFILNKLRVNRNAKVGIIAAILVFYIYLCNFSVSVIRASIMAVLSLYAVARTKEYDGLSALSIAASLLLIISPLELFNISFILSFVSVLSIILIMPVLNRLFSKIFYDKLAGSLALNFAVQLGLFVTQICYFGKVSVLSLLTNLVTVPLASFAFMFYICALLLAFILPPAAPLMNLFGIIMQLIVRFNNFVAGVMVTINVGVLSGFAILLSCAFMFIVSDYVFVKKKTKAVLSSITLALIVSLMII